MAESHGNEQGEIAGSQFPLAEAIRFARKNQSRSQDWLAREVKRAARGDGQRSGATRSTISRWESGEITPQPDSVRWIARALNLHVADLSAAANLQRELTSARRPLSAADGVARSEYTRETAYLMLRRQFLNNVLAVAGLGFVSSPQSSPWSEDHLFSNLDEFVNLCESNFDACWRLLKGSEVMVVPSVLMTWLPLLDAATSRPSKYHQQIARLACQGYILAGLVTVLQGGNDRAEWCCKQAHQYAVISGDVDLQVAALKHLAAKYQSAGMPLLTLRTYQEALRLCARTTPLLRGRTFLGLALAYAECGRHYEAERNLALAEEHFPDQPQEDASYGYADCNRSSLYHYGGLIRLAFNQAKEAWTTLDAAMHDKQIAVVPERTVIEIVNCQASAAIEQGDLELACEHVEIGHRGGLKLQSATRLAESTALYQRIAKRWPDEPRVGQLAEMIHG